MRITDRDDLMFLHAREESPSDDAPDTNQGGEIEWIDRKLTDLVSHQARGVGICEFPWKDIPEDIEDTEE